MSDPKHTSDWLETQVKKLVREELAGGCPCNNKNTRTSELADCSISIIVSASPRKLWQPFFNEICLVCPEHLFNGRVVINGRKMHSQAGSSCDPDQRDSGSTLSLLGDEGDRIARYFAALGEGIDAPLEHFVEAKCCFDVTVDPGAVNHDVADHESSPSRSGLCADTQSSPMLTVQENTGAGAVSPSAPAQPRFVQLGASVYDRKLDRFLVAVNEAGARSIADELNVCPDRVVDFKWEDAK